MSVLMNLVIALVWTLLGIIGLATWIWLVTRDNWRPSRVVVSFLTCVFLWLGSALVTKSLVS